jgi:hypothetical protein
LRSVQVTVGVEPVAAEGRLFAVEAKTLSERREARRESLAERVARAAEIVAGQPEEPFVVWCDLNAESEALTKAIPGAVEVTGSMTPEEKEERLSAFLEGRPGARALVSKPSICGFGINMQHCARVVFVGLSDSFERMYQATRRCWRFGQTRAVEVYVVTADREGAVVENIRRKQRQADGMMERLALHSRGVREAS